MATFNGTYGPSAMLSSVALYVASIETAEPNVDVHTITLVRSGNHGEFDLTVEASDDSSGFLEERRWTGIANRYGGCSELEEVEV